MNSVDFKDAGIRAAKTFVAAAVPLAASVPAAVSSGNFSTIPTTLTVAGLAGAAAVITFVWNVLLDWSRPAS